MRSRYRERHPFTGLIVGAVSGLAGTLVMTQFQDIWNKISEDMQTPRSDCDAKPWEEQKEDSTMKAAGKIAEKIGRFLSREGRSKAGPWVHYAFGTSIGAVFGYGNGTGFGAWDKSRVRRGRLRHRCFPCCA